MVNCTIIQILRSYRIYGMAIFDWIITLLGAYILAKLLAPYFRSENFYRVFFNITFGLIIIAIFLHKMLNINTMLGYYLGLNEMPTIIRC